MNFWVALFNGNTWREFQQAGSNVTGFNEIKSKYINIVKPKDLFLCYLTGGSFRWVGALEVLGVSEDKRKIWESANYPVRFDVKPLVELKMEIGIPMKSLEGKVDFYKGPEDAGKYKGIIRTSLRPIKNEDGELILNLLKANSK